MRSALRVDQARVVLKHVAKDELRRLAKIRAIEERYLRGFEAAHA